MDTGVDRARRLLVFCVQSHSRQRHSSAAEEVNRENDFSFGRGADALGCRQVVVERILTDEPV